MAARKYAEGIGLLRRPVLPLVSMLQFIFMTGPFATVTEVIEELPEPIETDRAEYPNPRALLLEYLDILVQYEPLKKGDLPAAEVVDEQNNPVDSFVAAQSIIQQQILTRELARINSVLCAPCGCVLCCVGPDRNMAQQFFEIPLEAAELDLFAVPRRENRDSLCRSAYDDDELCLNRQPFYATAGPGLFHWKNGWSLILPKESRCPNLDAESGKCLVYKVRPGVCRRPQIFSYLLEPIDTGRKDVPAYRIRQAVLAIVDCPYVRDLKNEIAEYASASGLHLILKENKT